MSGVLSFSGDEGSAGIKVDCSGVKTGTNQVSMTHSDEGRASRNIA